MAWGEPDDYTRASPLEREVHAEIQRIVGERTAMLPSILAAIGIVLVVAVVLWTTL